MAFVKGEVGKSTVEAAFGRKAHAPRLSVRVEREGGKAAERDLAVDGALVRIGSHELNDVVISDTRVSRFHLQLVREDGRWRVKDTGSLNGTLIQGLRIHDAELPLPEAVIDLGESRIRVRDVPGTTSLEALDQAAFGDLYGRSVAMRALFALLARIAPHDASVLIEGESGTGKELVAAELVRRSPRAKKPFVVVDCGAITPTLIESELFGHVRGAFTGAERDRVGAFEAADGGTVFLDEIGELPLDLQPKLLRAIEQREIRRLGETKVRKVDVRVLCATNRRLEKEINQGRFREDVYYRLSVITVRVPPLRERTEDIDLLVRVFLDSLSAGSAATHLFTAAVLDDLRKHTWPGNVRELRNVVERALIFERVSAQPKVESPRDESSEGPRPVDLEQSFRDAKEEAVTDFERTYITALLEWAGGNISRAARKAKMDRMNLHRLAQRLGLRLGRGLKDD